jgi:hypothetical protein
MIFYIILYIFIVYNLLNLNYKYILIINIFCNSMLRTTFQRLNNLSLTLSFLSSSSKFHAPKVIRSKFQIKEKKKINHDSYVYKLVWAGPKFKLGIGQHFRILEHLKTWEYPEG